MKQLIKFIISSIVANPSEVKLEESKNNQTGFTQLTLTVAPEDIGKVIGKKGKIIKAIRDLVKVKAIIKGEKVILNLKED